MRRSKIGGLISIFLLMVGGLVVWAQSMPDVDNRVAEIRVMEVFQSGNQLKVTVQNVSGRTIRGLSFVLGKHRVDPDWSRMAGGGLAPNGTASIMISMAGLPAGGTRHHPAASGTLEVGGAVFADGSAAAVVTAPVPEKSIVVVPPPEPAPVVVQPTPKVEAVAKAEPAPAPVAAIPEKPVVAASAPEPPPVAVQPTPKVETVVKAEPAPAPVAAIPEKPVVAAPAPEPAPVIVQPTPRVEAVAKAEPAPAPVAAIPEKPVVASPAPEPAPVAVQPTPKVEAVAKAEPVAAIPEKPVAAPAPEPAPVAVQPTPKVETVAKAEPVPAPVAAVPGEPVVVPPVAEPAPVVVKSTPEVKAAAKAEPFPAPAPPVLKAEPAPIAVQRTTPPAAAPTAAISEKPVAAAPTSPTVQAAPPSPRSGTRAQGSNQELAKLISLVEPFEVDLQSSFPRPALKSMIAAVVAEQNALASQPAVGPFQQGQRSTLEAFVYGLQTIQDRRGLEDDVLREQVQRFLKNQRQALEKP